jgi:Rrf2 family transcriptional regulator, nitric oxide-sensitive transcriptional repressor
MRLTVMTDYSMRLLMYVARRPDRLCTISEVADAHDISRAHLRKITHQLGQLGVLQTVRGVGGGIRLARPAADINVGAVIREMEPDWHLVACHESADNGCVLTGRCALAGVLDDALLAFLQHLDQFTLAQVASPTSAPQPVPLSRRPPDGARAMPPKPAKKKAGCSQAGHASEPATVAPTAPVSRLPNTPARGVHAATDWFA